MRPPRQRAVLRIVLVLLIPGLAVAQPRPRQPPPMPTVTMRMPQVTGALDKQLVRRALERNRQKFQYCYEKHLVNDPDRKGVLRAAWEITPSGHAANVGTMGLDGEVAACTKRVLEIIRFPRPPDDNSAAVNVAFVMKPR